MASPDSFRNDFTHLPILLFQKMRGWLSLRIRRVLPQCGQRAGVLTVCGTRWACASEAAIRGTMATLYHALGTSRILEGLMARWGFVEPRERIGCWAVS